MKEKTTYRSISDEELVVLLRAGDRGAGDALYLRHEKLLYHFAHQVPKYLFAEAVSYFRERFARLLAEYDFSRDVPFAKALSNALHFARLDVLKAADKRETHEEELAEGAMASVSDGTYHESAAEILDALALSPQQRRTAEFLFAHSEMKFAEAAEALGMTAAALYKHRRKIAAKCRDAGYAV